MMFMSKLNWAKYVLLVCCFSLMVAGGIGTELRRTIRWGKGAGDETAALFFLLVLSIFAIDQFSSFMRQRLVSGKQRD